jgi:hypothetical protein
MHFAKAIHYLNLACASHLWSNKCDIQHPPSRGSMAIDGDARGVRLGWMHVYMLVCSIMIIESFMCECYKLHVHVFKFWTSQVLRNSISRQFNPFVPRHRINPFGLILWLDFHVLFVCRKFFVRIESTQKGRFYGSKSSRPGYVPRETFFIEFK